MKPLVGRDRSRQIDRRWMEAGVPGLILMENAGRGAADVVLERFAGQTARPVVIGGAGNNGGDAWVVARRLMTRGLSPRVFLAGTRDAIAGDARCNLEALEATGVRVEACSEVAGESGSPALESALESASLVVEGLFGTGLERPIEGWRARLVQRINTCGAPVVALDLPSGIDADTGQVLGVAIEAKLTVTFAAHKRGLWQAPGRVHAGDIVLRDIGVPALSSSPVGLLELADGALARRRLDAHKGTAGHVLVVAGSDGTSGAALLTGRGALRGGAGRVTLLSRADLGASVLELMARVVPDDGALPRCLELAEGKTSAVVGPGLGLDDAGAALARGLSSELSLPTVLDADALTHLAGELRTLRSAAGPRVLTPHPGEAARLLRSSSAEVQADRYAAAVAIAAESGHVVALKGAGTVVAAPDGRLAVCPFGTPALGVAGTGDVLAGALGATLATGLEPFEAATSAVVLHALAGERSAASDRGLLASEVADALPGALEAARGR